MKALKLILGFLVIASIGFYGVGKLLPDTVKMERSIVTQVSPEKVFKTLNNFKNFNKWSPWHKLDPKTKYSFSGPESGIGAKMQWTSDNSNVGSGEQEITDIKGRELINIRLAFTGEEGDAASYYKIEGQANGSRITWGFTADFSDTTVGRYFGLMMDSMLGPQYEEGLNNLKTYLEAG